MRQLKHHEAKLLKKHDFLQWKQDQNQREIKVMRRYHVQNRDDYQKYNKMVGSIRHLSLRLSTLPASDPFRTKHESQLLAKLYDMGLLDTGAKMSDIMERLNVSAFCRRRLPVVMVRLKMSETVGQAVRYVEQGNVRVGPDTITDPAFMITRNMEDFVTWLDTSHIKRTIARYNDELDDFDLL
ncbi:putative IMP3-component of the U3 small nucleolar ribonucleo protein [Tilletiaria anomala UBC 951]|uniref:U3 small nucleolar ribonucleoprotein protein IMP3 n=1 Tax=Tilletiaria anomala (strain ATCC 24038 / CBS 436.72 / UBC 951) TaxID=1037660 RepID=A0A066WBL1_TILAU|nr:putative IMP3-component of the U3 small nucleolar ribonucleoprotein [Tilletiaria anomala UBC 951]KDN49908.1 putative IMP3-component of the U3 small nucleolar ribonucleo protein [Tilletiaria anomala UBC 951]